MKAAILDWIRSVADRITSDSIIQYKNRYELGDLQPDSLVTKYLLLNNSLIPEQITTSVTGGVTANGIVIAHTGMTFPNVAFFTPSGDKYTGISNVNDDGTNITVTGDDDGSGHFVDSFLIVISGATSAGSPPAGITQLTGDVTAGSGSGSQIATIVAINSHDPAFYDPTSSIQNQLNGKQANLGFTPYDGSVNPLGFVDDAQVVARVKVGKTTNLFGQIANISDVGHYDNTGSDNTFTVGAWLNFRSGTGNVIVEVTWINGHGETYTETFYRSGDASGATYGAGGGGAPKTYSFDTKCIRAADATTVTVSATVAGTVLYEVGCFIDKIVGNGGL